MTFHPAQYSALLLVTPEGHLLFHQRDNKRNDFSFQAGEIGMYGGGVENGETLEQAAIRELEEELGISIPEEALEFFADYQKTKEVDGFEQSCRVFLIKDIDRKFLKPNPKEGMGYVVINPDQDTASLPLTKMAKFILKTYQKKTTR